MKKKKKPFPAAVATFEHYLKGKKMSILYTVNRIPSNNKIKAKKATKVPILKSGHME